MGQDTTPADDAQRRKEREVDRAPRDRQIGAPPADRADRADRDETQR